MEDNPLINRIGVYKYVLRVHFGRRFDWRSMILYTEDYSKIYAKIECLEGNLRGN